MLPRWAARPLRTKRIGSQPTSCRS